MAHSYLNVLIHCVFSTKNRHDTLSDEIRPKLWKYITGIGANHHIPILSVGVPRTASMFCWRHPRICPWPRPPR